ncbi:MAG: hypothetical protein ABSA63_09325 [Thermoplasmata archaeon]
MITRFPHRPSIGFVQPGPARKSVPPIIKQETMVRRAIDPLSIVQRHPEHRLGSVSGHVEKARMAELARLLVQLAKKHAPHAITTEKWIALMSLRFIPGGLELPPDLFDS